MPDTIYLIHDANYGGMDLIRAKSPRQAMNRWCAKHYGTERPTLRKMYRDTVNGARHVGYIYRQSWCDIATVTPMEGVAP